MATIKTKNRLRYNFNVSYNKEVFNKCTEGQVMFSDAYVNWLEDEWMQANDKTPTEAKNNPETKQLIIGDVSKQRELLIAFHKFQQNNWSSPNTEITENVVDVFLKSNL